LADLETTQAKLRTTPTAGVEAEHSALYRRYFSAGYKGYIQASIAGGTLYGGLGLVIGGLVGVPLLFVAGPTALILAPIMATAFGLYGAHAFSGIGTTAAILADSDEHMEKRRTLLDRYAATKSPEEMQEISNQLVRDETPKPIEHPFHWRQALIGAVIGVALVALIIAIAPYAAPHLLPEALAFIGVGGAHGATGALTGLSAAAITATGAALGGLSGAIIGIDRGYIRRWMDKTEYVVHQGANMESGIAEREQDIQRLGEAARKGQVNESRRAQQAEASIPTQIIAHTPEANRPVASLDKPLPISPQTIAGLPGNNVSATAYEERLENLQLARSGS
jgi:hypothetical protein